MTKASELSPLWVRDPIAFLELIASNGLEAPAALTPDNVLRRGSPTTIRPFSQVYEYLPVGSLLNGAGAPDDWQRSFDLADPHSFRASAHQP